MKSLNFILSVAFMFFGFVALAQPGSDMPPNGEAGKCYAKCLIADQYETTTEQVEIKAAGTRTEVIPAAYETVTEQVVAKAASTRIEVIPAVYETVTEQYEAEAASTRIETLAPRFETVTERIETRPASTKWVKKRADRNCLSADPNDCQVWCLVEVPATYRTVSKKVNVGCAGGDGSPNSNCTKEVSIPAKYATRTSRVMKTPPSERVVEIPAEYATVTKTVLKTPATTREETIPAVYKTVSRKIVKTPATTRTIEIPAEYATITKTRLKTPATTREEKTPAVYKTVTRRVVKTPAQTRSLEIPAEYATVSKKVLKASAQTRTIEVPAEYATVTRKNLVKQGGFTEWREVVCGSNITTEMVRSVQRALKSRGYDPGPIDNVLGSRTKAALMKYQRDNNLPVGQMDFETLKSLGVNF